MVEVEAKFLLQDEGEVRRLLESLRSEGRVLRGNEPLEIVDTYLDTPDWQILQSGWACRWRKVGGKRLVGLKDMGVAEGQLQKRQDLELEVDHFPTIGQALPEGEVARKLAEFGVIDLREMIEVRNHRRSYELENEGESVITIAIDQVTVASAGTTKGSKNELSFLELELELHGGPERVLEDLARVLRDDLGFLPARLSKFERGLLVLGRPLGPGSTVEGVRLQEAAQLAGRGLEEADELDAAREYGACYVLDRVADILAEEPIAWEGLDPEGVHRMRIAIRRLRAGMVAFKSIVPGPVRTTLDQELKWIFGVLGTVRDLDVLQEGVGDLGAELAPEDLDCLRAYRDHLAERWKEARRALIEALSCERYGQLRESLIRVVGELAQGGEGECDEEWSVREAALQSLRKQSKGVLRAGRALDADSPGDDLHELRTDCKRLRYLLEVFQPAYGDRLEDFTRPLKRLQEELGQFHDACVGCERLRAFAALLPINPRSRDHLLALGQLIHAHRLQAARQRSRFRKAWARFDRRGIRKDLLASLHGPKSE